MKMRTRAAVAAIALVVGGQLSAGEAEARGASNSRSCLTSAARNLLSRIEQKFGSMQIISTCRPGARIAGSGRPSRHASGNAVDFNAGSRKGAVVRWLTENHHSGGTMTYSGMDHVHVDIGPHFVSLSGSRVRTASRSGNRVRTASRGDRFRGRMSLGAGRGRRARR